MHTQESIVTINRHTPDSSLLGKKAQLFIELHRLKLPTPSMFLLTSTAFDLFISHNNLRNKLDVLLKNADYYDPHALAKISQRISTLIQTQEFDKELHQQLAKHFSLRITSHHFQLIPSLLPHQQLYTPYQQNSGKGDVVFLDLLRQVWASQFTPKAISEYHFHHHLPIHHILVVHQPQIEVSGDITTIHPHTGNKSEWFIRASWGISTPDTPADVYVIDRNQFTLISQQLIRQTHKLDLNHRGQLTSAKVDQKHQAQPKLKPDDIITLGKIGSILSSHHFTPLAIQFSKPKGQGVIVTDYTQLDFTPVSKPKSVTASAPQPHSLSLITKGLAASPGIITAPVRIIHSDAKTSQIQPGEIVITTYASAKILPLFRKAAGVVTELGGPTSHAAIIAREVGCPAVTSALKITAKVKTGDVITLNGTTGEIFAGSPRTPAQTVSPTQPVVSSTNLRTATKVMVSLSFANSLKQVTSPIDGIGVVRGDIIFAQFGAHPKHIQSQKLHHKFTSYLTETLDQIASHYPEHPVIYCPANLYSSVYRELTGGKILEPEEPNPMLGYHGSLRLLTDPYIFDLELSVIKSLRESHHYSKLFLTLPFLRTPQELRVLKRYIATAGLRRGSGFQLYINAETPGSILSISQYSQIGIDGIVINTNQLGALTQGFDPNNPEVNQFYEPSSDALLKLIRFAADSCKDHNLSCFITGQALSHQQDIFHHLVKWGVTGVIVDPNQIEHARHLLYQAESKLLK